MVIFSTDMSRAVVDKPIEWAEPGVLNEKPGIMYSFDCADGISAQSIQDLYAAGFDVLAYAPTPEEFHLRVFVPRAGVSIAIA